MNWNVRLTLPARKQFTAITDKRIRNSISRRINGLEHEPEKQGKPLGDDLAVYRSIRAVGQRYRVIYRIEEERVVVVVVALGIHKDKDKDKKDVYALAQKMARLGLLDFE
jgi:mRNA interferase RelE/StbE